MTARCRRPECGRPLRTEESVARGYGPVCWQRIHPGVAARPAGELDPDQIPLPLEDTVDAETRKAAIDTVARHALAHAVEHDVSTNRIGWGDFAELSYDDFDAVLARVQQIAKSIRPPIAALNAAYQHLAPNTSQEGPAA